MSEQKRAYLDLLNRAAKECNDVSLLQLCYTLIVKSNIEAGKGVQND